MKEVSNIVNNTEGTIKTASYQGNYGEIFLVFVVVIIIAALHFHDSKVINDRLDTIESKLVELENSIAMIKLDNGVIEEVCIFNEEARTISVF